MSVFVAPLTVALVGVIGYQTSSAQTQAQLNPSISAPIRAKYSAIRDGKNWLNPIITIRGDGIEVVSSRIPSGRKIRIVDQHVLPSVR